MAHPSLWRVSLATVALGAFFFLFSSVATATDIEGVQSAALSQPQVNVLLRRTPTGNPLDAVDPFFGGTTFNIVAYYDTGSSGNLLSRSTAESLGVRLSRTGNNDLLTYEDVGVGGSESFYVSEPLYVGMAPYYPDVDVDNPTTQFQVYNQTFGPLRTQVAMEYTEYEELLGGTDVFGMPTMHGKIIVMDPKPVDTALENMRVYVYSDPNTPFNPANEASPGIPTTNRHVALSYGDFSRFTRLSSTEAGIEGPTLHDNPFIGPDPIAKLDNPNLIDNTPGITITKDGFTATGSFLFDTGAVTSMISTSLAETLHIRYVAGSLDPLPDGTTNPLLETFDPEHPEAPGTLLDQQFQMTVGGVGGSMKGAGFFLDSLLLPTQEGNPLDPDDPMNLRFLHAPVVVSDISVKDPMTLQELTLDGVFGMNYLVASMMWDESGTPLGDVASAGAFNWIVFDEPNGVLGLDVKGEAVPEPTMFLLLAIGAAVFLMRRCLFVRR